MGAVPGIHPAVSFLDNQRSDAFRSGARREMRLRMTPFTFNKFDEFEKFNNKLNI